MDDSIPIGEVIKPSSFQVLGEEGTEIVHAIRRLTGVPQVAEITDPQPIETLTNLIAMVRAGARNTYDDPLLKELGTIRKPVVLEPPRPRCSTAGSRRRSTSPPETTFR